MMPSSKHKVVPSAAVDLEAKKKEPNARGRCSMEPGYQPLKGKSFYLDVRKQAARLKKDLEDLGGTVETFLSKDINYVVSDRPEVQFESSKNAKAIAQSDASPAVSTPSPFHQSRDSMHRDSPSAPGGRVGVVTRGKAIVQKATTSQLYGTSNVLANARNWNVSIRYIDSVLKYINKEKQKRKESGIQSPQARNPQSREKTSAQAERKLSRPCLKVEDSSGHYRPTVKEMALWPRLTFDGHDGACPFDAREDNASTRGKKKTHGGPTGLQKADDAGDCHETTKEGNVHEEAQTAPRVGKRGVKAQHIPGRQRDVTKDIKRGYCECCHIKYSDLDKHLASEQHRNFVSENNHYVNLDTMIDEGPNIEQFLNDVMQHHEWQKIEGIRRMQIADDVTLISSPSNVPKRSECLQQASSPPQQHLQEQQQHHDHAEAQGTAPLKPTTASSTDTILDQTPRSTVSPKNDCPGPDAQDKECDLSCGGNLGTNVHSRNSTDHLSPSMRRSSRPTCGSKMSPSTPCASDSQTLPKNQQEETNSLQLHPTPGKSQNERRTPTNPPESCQNRTSRLSLSANRKRKRSLEHMGSPAVKPLTQENPDNETLQQTPLQDSPNTAMKKRRRLRLSLTARKRLLKETTSKTVDQGDESKSCQDTSVCVDGSGANKDQNFQDLEIQKQSTSENTKNSQETGTNKGGKDTGVITSKDQQQRASNQRDSLRRRSKRKRDSSDQHKTRSLKQRIIDSSSQAPRNVNSARGGDGLLENNRDTHGGSLQNTVSMDQIEEETGNSCTQLSRHPSTQHPNLPSVFCSDPNKIESSFLGFSSDEITETELRLQQLSASPTMYANKLQEAALNVYCMPSSELPIPDENDSPSGSSDMSDVEEAVVGMALRNLDNFPSDGSEWEAKVGGFMSVRLDTALQLKQRESALTQARIQEKENLGENQYQQIVSSPSKSVLVETREQNTSRPLEQSPRAERVLRTAIISNDPKSKPVVEGKSSTPRRVLSFESSNKTNPQKRKADQANHALISGSSSAQCPPENAPPNAGSTTSPLKSRKPVCSTPKRVSRSPRTGKYNLVFSPDTPKEERAIIVEHYVHDVTEEEIDFPKMSSPLQSNAIVSPIKNFTRSVSKRSRRSLGSPFKYKDPQAANGRSLRRSLIPRRRHSTSSVPAKVFHFLLNPPGSPRKREVSPSLPSSPLFKQSAPNVSHPKTSQSQPEPLHQIGYIPINEHNKVSPIFFCNFKPHFSSRILHPDIKRRHSDRLRRPSNQSCVDIHTSPHRPARSLSVSDGIHCSGEKTRDVYKFRDKKGLGKNANFNQMGSPPKSGSNRKLQPTAAKNSTKLREHQTDSTEKEVVPEYGLPFSFFM